LDFHDECVVLHDFGDGKTRTKVVSVLDVAHALARELDLNTGVLPPATLWWAITAAGTRIAVWREPRVWPVSLRTEYDGKPRRLRLPMPGLVFVCLPGRQSPYVFAAKVRPESPETQLYRCPSFNVFPTGRVCVGTHPFPAEPDKIPDAFFESHFSVTADTARGKSRRYPEDIGRLWTELNGQQDYPLDDLEPHLTVADALRLGE
jgi:PRTRC genetic system protein B